MQITRGIDKTVAALVQELKALSKEVSLGERKQERTSTASGSWDFLRGRCQGGRRDLRKHKEARPGMV